MDGQTDGTAWLYEKGKDAFERKDYGEALKCFDHCVSRLHEAAMRRGEAETFDSKATGYRHLDDYYDLLQTRIAAEHPSGSPNLLARGVSTSFASPAGCCSCAADSSSTVAVASGHRTPPPSNNMRTTLIMVCSPRAAPLPHLADEAVDVANVMPSHIRRGGSASDLRSELLRQPYTHFLFAGHGDADLGPAAARPSTAGASTSGTGKTLGFTSPSGELETVTPETLADVLGAHGSLRGSGGSLCTVVLNGCETENIGRRVCAAGVPYVLCWRTKAENRAARSLATSFFASLAAGRGHEQAFEDAKSAVRCMTRPGRLASGVASSVPAFELRDPSGPAPTNSDAPMRAVGSAELDLHAVGASGGGGMDGGAATARNGAPVVRRGFSPAPMAAGIPMLLVCAPEDAAHGISERL